MTKSAPPGVTPLERLPATVLASERSLRAHPGLVGLATVGFFALVAAFHRHAGIELPLAVTFAAPLAFCTYAIGPVAGATAAAAAATIWLADALALGVSLHQALAVFGFRLFSNLVIVAVATMAATAVRGYDYYLDAQRQLVQLRADLVSAFSHDLRTPLSAIVGYAQILSANSPNAKPAEVANALDRILANADRLDHLIGDMLHSADGDRATPIRISSFPPEDLVRAIRAEFDDTPRASEVALRWRVAPNLPPLRTDHAKLASILRNLVDNALKFTAHGSVSVNVDYDPAIGSHRFAVTDTGAGIAPAQLPHIFDRFFRAAATERTTGFGVGLFIVKRFAELLGGTVTVQSELGRGTSFVLTVPQQRAATPTPYAVS